jgi:hypothetical protein
MEKKPRKKKVLTVELENKVEAIQQDEVQTEAVKLEANTEYEFVGNGNFHTLPKGKVWRMKGATAEILINKGYGHLKK